LPAVAVSPVGGEGGGFGTALTWDEFALSPAEFTADTT
jgi:hypothetical protein